MTNLIRFATAVVSNPAFIAKDITGDNKPETFCNWGLRMIAEGLFGYTGFTDLNANQIHAKLKGDAAWQTVDGAQAALEAERGRLVVAAWTNPNGGPGHVAVVLPLPVELSSKWGKKVPKVANVGPKNGIMGANWAFSSEPQYFALKTA